MGRCCEVSETGKRVLIDNRRKAPFNNPRSEFRGIIAFRLSNCRSRPKCWFAWRVIRSATSRARAHHHRSHEEVWPRPALVAGHSGQSSQITRTRTVVSKDGASSRNYAASPGRGDRHRSAPWHTIYCGNAGGLAVPVSGRSVCMGYGGRQSCSIPQMARLERNHRDGARRGVGASGGADIGAHVACCKTLCPGSDFGGRITSAGPCGGACMVFCEHADD